MPFNFTVLCCLFGHQRCLWKELEQNCLPLQKGEGSYWKQHWNELIAEDTLRGRLYSDIVLGGAS
jgi:hypothetical protein